eukprot:Pgem_evm1s12999
MFLAHSICIKQSLSSLAVVTFLHCTKSILCSKSTVTSIGAGAEPKATGESGVVVGVAAADSVELDIVDVIDSLELDTVGVI